jgi:hypothetical protein
MSKKTEELNETKEIFQKCQCSEHQLQVELDDDFPNGIKEFYFSIWQKYSGGKMSMKEKKRWCKKIMKDGKPWADNVVLDKESALKIAQFIIENSK